MNLSQIFLKKYHRKIAQHIPKSSWNSGAELPGDEETELHYEEETELLREETDLPPADCSTMWRPSSPSSPSREGMGHVPKRSLVREVGGENPRENHGKTPERYGKIGDWTSWNMTSLEGIGLWTWPLRSRWSFFEEIAYDSSTRVTINLGLPLHKNG